MKEKIREPKALRIHSLLLATLLYKQKKGKNGDLKMAKICESVPIWQQQAASKERRKRKGSFR